MTRRATLAHAYARVRAWKSRLLTRGDAALLWSATDATSMHRAVEALGVGDPWLRLLRVYATAMRVGHRTLFDALLRLHEIENLKLLWRVAITRRSPAVIGRLWIDLGPFASFGQQTVDFTGTPYAGIVTKVTRAHGEDLVAAELAFDRWATEGLLAEARRLPRGETIARRLLELVARERDAQLEIRGAKWYGLQSIPACGDIDIVALLAEEELRAVRALVERQGDERLDVAVMRIVAASQIGAA